MEMLNYHLLFFLSVNVIIFIIFKVLLKQIVKNQPPSPPAFPIIGHFHLLKKPLYRSLQALATQYGPCLYLRLGSRRLLVVSSPSIVEECFTKNDRAFANRPNFIAGEYFGYNFTTFFWTPYGDHFRKLRRLINIEILSHNRLQISSEIRQEEIKGMLKGVFKRLTSSEDGLVEVEMNSMLMELTFNITMRIVAGKKCFEEGMGLEEKRVLLERLKWMFVPNIPYNLGDFFPILRWFSFIGLDKKVVEIQGARDAYLQSLINEHRTSCNKVIEERNKQKSPIDAYLKMQKVEPETYTDNIVKGLVGISFIGGADTSSLTLEWAMSLLLNHPEVLQKARAEIKNYMEGNHRLLEESDLKNLPYLNCIINETMRLYPASPLAAPHASSEDCIVGGYVVPRGTMLLMNIWAIHRDPKVWDEPNMFKPERFYKGVGEGEVSKETSFKFVPFGLGRRVCPGNELAMRVMSLTLGSLIQCFEWERVGEDMVDLSEGTGATMHMAKPLVAICRRSLNVSNLLHL